MRAGETVNEFETRMIDAIENRLRLPQNVYSEKDKIAKSQWKSLITRVMSQASFSHVETMPEIRSGNKEVMLEFFTALSLEVERVDSINKLKSRHTDNVLNDMMFTLQRVIDNRIWTPDIIGSYSGEPKRTDNLFDTYDILYRASFQSMGPFETLYTQKNTPDILREFSTEQRFSQATFHTAYSHYEAGTTLTESAFQPYFAAFTQTETELTRFSLDELVKSYEVAAFFHGNEEQGIDFHSLAALSYLYEKFSFELTRSKTEEELGIERNIVRFFEGIKVSSNTQLSATDTLAVSGSHVEVSIISLIEGDIPACIVDKIEQPSSISDAIWDDMLSGKLYQDMQAEYQLHAQRIKNLDEYMKQTEDIINGIESPEQYIRKQIELYSPLDPERVFSVSVTNRPPDRLRGDLKARTKFIREHSPIVKHFTVYEIITGKAEHELSRYRLTDLIVDWEDNSDLAYISQYRDWIINGYADYIDSIDADRLDHYFSLLHEINGKDKIDIHEHLAELKELLDESTYTGIELDINFGLEVIKQVSSVFDYAFPVSGIKSYFLSLGLSVGTSLLQAENASTDIERELYRKEALNNFIYTTGMSTLTIAKSVGPVGTRGMGYLKLGGEKLNKNGGYFFNAANEKVHFIRDSIKESKGSLFRYDFKKLQRVNGQIGIPMGPIRRPLLSLAEGDISPLRAKTGLNLTPPESTPIHLEFEAVRIDDNFNTGVVSFAHHDSQFTGKINTFVGEQVHHHLATSLMDDNWRAQAFTQEIQVIHVANGDKGTVAIKIPLENIVEGKPVLITAGKLQGSTTVYAKDEQYFYVYRTGKKNAGDDWQTASDGVDTLYGAHVALKGGGVNAVRLSLTNSDVPSIFSANSLNPYQQSSITYYGKPNSKMPDTEYSQVIFDYNEAQAGLPRLGREGHSHALLSRSDNGELKIVTSSEDVKVTRKKVKSLKYNKNTFGASSIEVPDYLSLKTADKWKHTIKRKIYRRLDLAEVSRLLDKADYYSPQPKLKSLLEDLLTDLKFDHKTKFEMKRILHILRRNEGFSPQMIDAYVDRYSVELFPLNEGGDLSLSRVRELRINMLKQNMKESSGYSPYKLAVQGGVESLTIKGVSLPDKQWVGRGECEKASMFFMQDAMRREIQAGHNGAKITWNHFYNPKSDGSWIDATWKQFFELRDTQGKNPIFEGNVEDFRNLGLPEEATHQYLLFLNKI